MENEKARLLNLLRSERAALLAAVSNFDNTDWQRLAVSGQWPLADVLAHLAGWQEWMLEVYPYRLAHGRTPEDRMVTADTDTTDAWNRRFVGERQGRPPEQILRELADGFERLIAFIEGLDGTRLIAGDPWPNSAGSLADYFRMNVAEHDREHRQELQSRLPESGAS